MDGKPKKKIDLKAYARSFHEGEAERKIEAHVTAKLAATKPKEHVYRQGYVYYCGDGQGRVKIGFSSNPWSRCSESRCFNPDVKLLAVERGTHLIEHQRHDEYREYHLALEWFKLEGRLAAHVATLDDKWDGKD